MRLRVFFVIICSCLVTTSMAQNRLLKTRFTCRATQGNANELLHDLVPLWRDCGVNIEYSPSNLDNTKKITLPGGETTIGTVLNKILQGQRVTIIEKNDKIIIGAAATPLPPGALLDKYVLFGFIQQEGSLEPLPFASIREVGNPSITLRANLCESNIAGFYSMNLPAGVHQIEISFTGFSSRVIEVDMNGNTRFNLTLSPAILPEVQVSTANVLMRDAANKLDSKQSGTYSNMLGETDPVRAIYLLPGNMESQESGGKLIVRGGEPGQSLFLLDGNLVFNPAHLLGEISVVSNTSIKSIRQYKNDFPSRLSGGLSAFTEIQTKDGNMDRWSGEGAAGLSSLAVTLEGPLKKDRTALMVSGRQSVGDAFNKDMFAYDAAFSDLHIKLTTRLNKNNKLMISGYTGDDRLQLTQTNSDYLQTWSNGLFTINWNLVTGKRSFVNTTFNVSSFDNYVALKYSASNNSSMGIPLYQNTVFNNYAKGERLEGKTSFELTASPQLQFNFGGKYEQVTIRPYTTMVTTEFQEEKTFFRPKPELLFGNVTFWYENEIRIGDDLLLRPGMHVNAYSMEAYNNRLLQPRFFASYRLDNKQQLHLSYAHTGQWLHQVASPYTGINREIWLPANERLQPALSKMINIGYQYRNSRVINVSADVYYKRMENLVNFSEKTNILFYSDSIEKKLITGKGWSYGTELVAERKFKKWKTLLSYTLSWSWRQFDSLNNGKRQPYRYDRRHNLNMLVSHQPRPDLDVSVLWHMHSGDWVTIPTAIPANPDDDMNKNGTTAFTPFREKIYNRVNVNTTFYLNPWKKFRHKLSAGVHIMDQPADDYTTQFSTIDNDDFDMDLFPDQAFKYSWYLTYNISF
ncbi:MAG TPA: TonB-dependent receptor [Niastella sp.]